MRLIEVLLVNNQHLLTWYFRPYTLCNLRIEVLIARLLNERLFLSPWSAYLRCFWLLKLLAIVVWECLHNLLLWDVFYLSVLSQLMQRTFYESGRPRLGEVWVLRASLFYIYKGVCPPKLTKGVHRALFWKNSCEEVSISYWSWLDDTYEI